MSFWKLVQIGQCFLKSCLNISNLPKYSFIMPFYAVARGRVTGIFNNWADCEAQVKGYPHARYKKFDSVVNAQDFINSEGESGSLPNHKQPSASITSNLKRSYSKTKEDSIKSTSNSSIKKAKTAAPRYDHNNSDDSDDLDDIIIKQVDDVERRLNSFKNGLNKIMTNSKKTILIEPQKRCKSSNSEFEMDTDGYVQVYTDGACSANGTKGARAGLGVYWCDNHPFNISEPVSGRATNNCGEIQAATKAINIAIQNGIKKLSINTDSQFLINSVIKWMPGWKRKGWKLASGDSVKNEKDFKDLDSVQNKLQIKWNYVEAHKGIHGNEMADQLAKAGAEMYRK